MDNFIPSNLKIVSSSQISNHFSSNQQCIKPNWPADFVMNFLLGKTWLDRKKIKKWPSRKQKSELYQFSRITAPHTVTSNWMLLEWRCCHISEGISFRFWPKEVKSQKWAPLRPLRFFTQLWGRPNVTNDLCVCVCEWLFHFLFRVWFSQPSPNHLFERGWSEFIRRNFPISFDPVRVDMVKLPGSKS